MFFAKSLFILFILNLAQAETTPQFTYSPEYSEKNELFLLKVDRELFESFSKSMAEMSEIERTVDNIFTKGTSRSRGTVTAAPLTSHGAIIFQLIFPSQTQISTTNQTLAESGILADYLKKRGRHVPKDVAILFSADPSIEAITTKNIWLTDRGFGSEAAYTTARATVPDPQKTIIQTQVILPRKRFETVIEADGSKETHRVGGLGATFFPRLRNRFGSHYQAQAPLMPVEPVVIGGTARAVARRAPEKFDEKFRAQKPATAQSLQKEVTRTANTKFDEEFGKVMAKNLQKNFEENFRNPLVGNGQDSFLADGHLEMASDRERGIAIRGAKGIGASPLMVAAIPNMVGAKEGENPIHLRIDHELLENIFRVRFAGTRLTDSALVEMFGKTKKEPEKLDDLIGGSGESVSFVLSDKNPVQFFLDRDQIEMRIVCQSITVKGQVYENGVLTRFFAIEVGEDGAIRLRQSKLPSATVDGKAIDREAAIYIQSRFERFRDNEPLNISKKIFLGKSFPLAIKSLHAQDGKLVMALGPAVLKEAGDR